LTATREFAKVLDVETFNLQLEYFDMKDQKSNEPDMRLLAAIAVAALQDADVLVDGLTHAVMMLTDKGREAALKAGHADGSEVAHDGIADALRSLIDAGLKVMGVLPDGTMTVLTSERPARKDMN
jgi:hypothetical protein